MLGEDGGEFLSGSTIVTSSGPAAAAPSVLRNVERIVANHRAAQREVQDTMEALRERYRQLQQRLEDRRRGNCDQRRQNRRQQNETQTQNRFLSNAVAASSDLSSSFRRRHPFDRIFHNNNDSNRSVFLESACTSPSLTITNEEIIALHVLGDYLSRGDETSSSANDLHLHAHALGGDLLYQGGRGDSSIEEDGAMMISGAINNNSNDNVSSSSYDNLIASLRVVSNGSDNLVDQGVVVLATNNTDDRVIVGPLSAIGVSTVEDAATATTTTTTAASSFPKIKSPGK